ncbi:MAG: hypothetical protein QXQ81_05250 [Candidatus Thorarchaeota archaeon]
MNAYFVIVLMSLILFFVVWFLGWLLERLSRALLEVTHRYGSRAWYLLVGPGVAMHELSHALGCLLTRTNIVEFKPIQVIMTDSGVILGYVRHEDPENPLKSSVIGLAPVAVSTFILFLFALGATYLIPEAHLGGQALSMLGDLIAMKADPILLYQLEYPLVRVFGFIYEFLYALAQLGVLNPVFWIILFFAMTIMFSNAPSSVDVEAATPGLKAIIVFDIVWMILAYLNPAVGWLLFGIFEFLLVMFSIALAMAGLGYGMFIMVAAMSRIRPLFQPVPIVACILTAVVLWMNAIGTAAAQTVMSLAVLIALGAAILLLQRRIL